MKWKYSTKRDTYYTNTKYTYKISELKDFYHDLVTLADLFDGIVVRIHRYKIRIEANNTSFTLRALMRATSWSKYWRWGSIDLKGIESVGESDVHNGCNYANNHCVSFDIYESNTDRESESDSDRECEFDSNNACECTKNASESDASNASESHPWNVWPSGIDLSFYGAKGRFRDDAMDAASEYSDNTECGCGCDDYLNSHNMVTPRRHFD